MPIRYVDRTRIVTYQRCPRRRYYEFEWQGRGIVPVAMSIPLVTGHFVHVGAEHILRGVMRAQSMGRPYILVDGDLNTYVETALDEYWTEVVKRGFDIEENEDAAAVAKEQAALTEALIRLFGMKVVPWLLADYDVLDVEVECEWQMADGLVMMGRPDAVLLHRETGDIHLLSLKTKASWDARADKSNQHDDQGISETVCFEAHLQEQLSHGPSLNLANMLTHHVGNGRTSELKVQAVLMPHLIKGDRRKDHETGQYSTASPLIKGYRREGLLGPEYAHSWYWTDENGARRGLSKGKGAAWEKFNAWETDGGIRAWMQLLNTGTVQPEAGDPLASSVIMPTPYYRQQLDIDDWKDEIEQQEGVDIPVGMRELGGEHSPGDRLWRRSWNQKFRREKVSCHYPSDCPYIPLCFGPPQMAEDPLATGRYQWREPHHAVELIQLQGVAK